MGQSAFKIATTLKNMLCAQWKAADAADRSAVWAERTFWAALAGIMLSVVGVILVWTPFRETRRSNRISARNYGKARLDAKAASRDGAAALALADRNANAAAKQVAVAERVQAAQLRPYL